MGQSDNRSAGQHGNARRHGSPRLRSCATIFGRRGCNTVRRLLSEPCGSPAYRRLIRQRQSSMPIESLEHCLQTGHYSRKQLFSRNRILQWSHRSRFEMARRMVEPYAGGMLLDYGCGDATFLAMVHDLFPRATGAEIDRARVEECQTRLQSFPSINFTLTSDLAGPEHDGLYHVLLSTHVLDPSLEIAVEDSPE